MKFIIIRSNLKDGLSVVDRAIGENLNLPILKNVLLDADENRIKITATNLEISISFSAPGKVIEKGIFTVPINILANLINNIKSDRLNIEKRGNRLQIKTDNYEATINGLSAEEFPITPKIKNQNEFIEIKTEVLKEALNQVLVSTQPSDLRPELNSVLFDFSLNNLKLVTTDSFRLSERMITSDHFTTNYKQGFSVLVPLKTAQELARVLKDGEILRVYHDESQILFKTDQFEFLSRLVEGNFPDYTAIVPKKFEAEVILNKQELLDALKLAGVFGSKNSEVKFKVRDNKKILEITSSDQALGENNYMLQAKIQGKLQEITFNWRYVTDALKALKTEEVFIGVNGESDPAEIKSPGDGSYFYILKPIVGV